MDKLQLNDALALIAQNAGSRFNPFANPKGNGVGSPPVGLPVPASTPPFAGGGEDPTAAWIRENLMKAAASQPQFNAPPAMARTPHHDFGPDLQASDANFADALRRAQGIQNPALPSGMPRPGAAGLALIVGLLGNALDKHHGQGGQFAQAFMQGNAEAQNRAYQTALEAANAKRTGLQTEAQLYDRQGNRILAAQQQQGQDERQATEDEYKRKSLEQGNTYKQLSTLQNLQNAYNGAKSKGALIAAGQRWAAYEKANGLAQTAPDADTMARDGEQITVQNAAKASQDWERAYKPRLNAMGEITAQDAKSLEETRLAIAQRYGIDPSMLPPVPTGETLRKKAYETRKEEYAQKFTFLQQQEKDKLIGRAADRDLAEQRLGIMRSNLELSQSRDPYALAQYNAQLRAWNNANKGYNVNAQATVDKLATKRDGLQRAYDQATDDKIKDKLKTQLDETQGQIASLKSTMEPMMDLNVMGADVQLPNLSYQPKPEASAVPPVPQGHNMPQSRALPQGEIRPMGAGAEAAKALGLPDGAPATKALAKPHKKTTGNVPNGWKVSN